MHPTLGHGKICYLEIPAADADQSARFYEEVFGWNVRTHGDGSLAFDDGVGEVSGTWLSGREPIDASFVHIMTDDADRTCRAVVENGGTIVRPVDPAAREVVATFRDPAGNVFSIYQSRSLAG